MTTNLRTIVPYCQEPIVPDAGSRILGTFGTMSVEVLLRRIDERLRQLKAADPKMSERRILMSQELDFATIRRIRNRGQTPGVVILGKLETALRVPPGYLTEAVSDREAVAGPIKLTRIYVKGAVQAGIYRDAIEWDGDEWYSMTVPTDDRFPGVERFGIEVRGNSMNAVYPEGTVVLVVRFGDIARGPKSGERVVALRRSAETGEFEATLKEYQLDGQGRHILWPRSDDPDFQSPFILSSAQVPVSQSYEPLPTQAFAGDLSHAAGEPDVTVAALVVGSFRKE